MKKNLSQNEQNKIQDGKIYFDWKECMESPSCMWALLIYISPSAFLMLSTNNQTIVGICFLVSTLIAILFYLFRPRFTYRYILDLDKEQIIEETKFLSKISEEKVLDFKQADFIGTSDIYSIIGNDGDNKQGVTTYKNIIIYDKDQTLVLEETTDDKSYSELQKRAKKISEIIKCKYIENDEHGGIFLIDDEERKDNQVYKLVSIDEQIIEYNKKSIKDGCFKFIIVLAIGFFITYLEKTYGIN